MKQNIILGAVGIILMFSFAGIVSPELKTGKQPSSNRQNGLMAEEVTAETKAKVDEQLIAANNRFAFKLFEKITAKDEAENVFISPMSIAIALSMASNGADGETMDKMLEALELGTIPLENIDSGYRQLLQTLQTETEGIKIAIANSLWANEEVKFKPEFIEDSQEFYEAKATNLDFADIKSKDVINNWVKEQTNNKITEIVDSISPDNILFLINAVYFKGEWTYKFNKEITTEKPFYISEDESQQHPMMSRRGEYLYYETEQFQAIELPYGDKQASMYIFLPKEDSNLTEFTNSLTPENWQKWTQEMRSQPGTIALPKFELEYETELNSVLSALGMEIAFDRERADFSEMIEQSVHIDKVKHKTFLEVNEEGTEAAGVTSIGIRVTSMPTEKPFAMNVNRPFFCAIRDKETNSILFMGNIRKP